MKKELKQFLEFNGRTIYFLAKDGIYWVAIKPICEALNVNYNRQFQNLKESKLFNQLFAIQQMVAADGKSRQMVCLPEKYIYGWLFQIKSESPDLIQYQKRCCDILFDYFHGSITNRETLIQAKTKEQIKIDSLEKEVSQIPQVKELNQLKRKQRGYSTSLKKLDQEYQHQQYELFIQSSN